MTLPVISSFWTGSKLTFLEQLCLKSFADTGHRTRLYSDDPDLNVPDGVELVDAADILPVETQTHGVHGFAPFADRFRLNLMAQTDEVWVDCDVVAVKPLMDREYIFAPAGRYFCNAVLRLPKSSTALANLLEFVNAQSPWIPLDWPWKHHFRPPNIPLDDVRGDRIMLDPSRRTDYPYMLFGPQALHYFLLQSGEAEQALPEHYFYPIHPVEIRKNYFRQRFKVSLPDDAILIHHIGGKPLRAKFARMVEFQPPHRHSLIGELCVKHGIDPMEAIPEMGADLDATPNS